MTKAVTAVRAASSAEGERIDLAWTNPPAAAFAGAAPLARIRVVRRERHHPHDPNDGAIAYDGPVIAALSDGGLAPLTRYYYTVYAFDAAAGGPWADAGSQATALSTARYGQADRLYRLLPAVHQREDRALGPADLAGIDPGVAAALAALPPGVRERGQLHRFLLGAAAPLDLVRSHAEALRELHDIDRAPPEFLAPLARLVGWDPDQSLPLAARRNEVRAAPRLLRRVGTPASVRELVTRYTGWTAQVAELDQHIARANVAPRLHVFATTEDPGGWRGADDAAPALGFGGSNASASGSAGASAVLIGTVAGPFALRHGMQLAVTADDRIPVTVVLGRGDFADISAATAAEVATVLNQHLSEVTAVPVAGGKLELRSNTLGPASQVVVEQLATSLVSLEPAPRGRLCVFEDASVAPVRLRLFHEVLDSEAARLAGEAVATLAGAPGSHGLLPGEAASPRVSAGPILGFEPGAEAQGAKDAPAVLTSAPGPFPLPVESELALRVDGGPALGVRVRGTEYLRDAQGRVTEIAPVREVDAVEIAAAVNAQAGGAVAATAAADGRLALRGRTLGPQATLAVVPALLPCAAAAQPPAPAPARPGRRIHYKTFAGGAWGDALPLGGEAGGEQGEPAAVALPGGRILVAWVQDPDLPGAVIAFRTGASPAPRVARLASRVPGPYPVVPGSRLLVRGPGAQVQGVTFVAADFADPSHATAAEVAAALGAQLTGIAASAQADGTLLLQTTEAGGHVQLAIDLRVPSAAAALGFAEENAAAAGDWGEEIAWDPPGLVPAGPGRYADLAAVVDPTGIAWLFWARHVNGAWRVESSRWTAAGGWIGVGTLVSWSQGGDREPCPVLDGAGRIWLFFARRTGAGTPEDVWTLRRRVFYGGAWGGAAAVTIAPAAPARAADREPGAVRLPGGALRVYFRSDRAGGVDLWSLTVDPATGIASPPAPLGADPAADSAPAPVISGGRLLLLHRSDRSVPLARVATRPPPAIDARVTSPTAAPPQPPWPVPSLRLADTGTLSRNAGATTVLLGDAPRIGRRLSYDDLLAYTPQKPRQVYRRPELNDPDYRCERLGDPREAPIRDDDRFVRGTVALYIGQVLREEPLAPSARDRLRAILDRFVPIHVRPFVVVAPRLDVELVYPAKVGPGETSLPVEASFSGETFVPGLTVLPWETFVDRHPAIEHYGDLQDVESGVATGWSWLLATTAGHVSAQPGVPATLAHRTFFLPPT